MSGLARSIDALLAHSPLQWMFRRRAARRLVVLAYHGIDDPDRFGAQLDWLARHCRVIDLDRLLEAIAGRRELPSRAVLITFDDGRRSLLERGLPLLREHDLPAVTFVVAGLVDTDRRYWFDEVRDLVDRGGMAAEFPGRDGPSLARALKGVSDARRLAVLEELRHTASGEPSSPADPQLHGDDLRELQEAGVAIGNHTWSHPVLPRCEPDKVREEIERAHQRLAEILGEPPRAFAYPNGDGDATAARVLEELGYEAAFLFDHRVSRLPLPDPFAISRVRVNSDTALDRFRVIVSGLHPALHRIRGGR